MWEICDRKLQNLTLHISKIPIELTRINVKLFLQIIYLQLLFQRVKHVHTLKCLKTN